MTCSPAQLEANRLNAARSSGPRTPEGKFASRRNGLKHGLTGKGVVLSREDAREVDRRFAELEAELRPSSGLERSLVKRVALMTVRLDRSAEHESHVIAHRVRHAVADFDDARLAEAENLLAWIAHQPETNARRLRGTPEGLGLLIGAMEGLRSDLDHAQGPRWDFGHGDRLHALMGRRWSDLPVSRARSLTEAIDGRFQGLDIGDGPGLTVDGRRKWAVGQMRGLIDAELAALKDRLEGFDRELLEQDRDEAPGRAMFDASKDSILARKYEAASERALFRALRELRELRQARAEPTRSEDEPEEVAAGDEAEGVVADGGPGEVIVDEGVATDPAEGLGSCSPEASDDSDEGEDVDGTTPTAAPTPLPRHPDLERLAWNTRRMGSRPL